MAGYGERASVAVGDVTNVDHADGSIAVIFNFAVLHHVPNWRTALCEISRVLAPAAGSSPRITTSPTTTGCHVTSSGIHRTASATPNSWCQLDAANLEVIGVEDKPGQLLVAATKRP